MLLTAILLELFFFFPFRVRCSYPAISCNQKLGRRSTEKIWWVGWRFTAPLAKCVTLLEIHECRVHSLINNINNGHRSM